jgi:DNA-3-methyladenine glycosylase I
MVGNEQGFGKLYTLIEKTVRNISRKNNYPQQDFEKDIKKWRNRSKEFKDDDDFFKLLVKITFYSGFKAMTASDKMNVIIENLGEYQEVEDFNSNDIERLCKQEGMIRNVSKIRATILNARIFDELISEYGTFRKYLDTYRFRTDDWDSKMDKLYRDLKKRFHYLGPVTTYHFLMDIGAWVAKPDRQIVSLFDRLGLLKEKSSKKREQEVIEICRKMAKQTGEKIRVVDMILVNMGQGLKFGLDGPICPKYCKYCQIKKNNIYCKDGNPTGHPYN